MSVPNWRRNAQLLSTFTPTDTVVGTYEKRDGELSVVSFGTYDTDDTGLVKSFVSVKSNTRYRPWPGEPVVLTWVKGQLRITGPASTYSGEGVITRVGNPTVGVAVDGKDYNLPYAVSLTGQLAVNDYVAIDWDIGYVKDKLTAAALGAEKEPKLTTDQHPFTLYFFAKQSGSRKSFNPKGAAPAYSKWWTQDVIADDDNVGGWFYGDVLRKTLRDDAYISSVEIYLPVRTTKGGLPKIGRHSQDKRPADKDSLSVQDEHTPSMRGGWVRLPVEWAQSWRNNPGGVGVSGSGPGFPNPGGPPGHGPTTYKGIQANRQSGKLRIRGRQ
jgi:hypothetical protein